MEGHGSAASLCSHASFVRSPFGVSWAFGPKARGEKKRKSSGTDMAGRPRHRTMEMIGGSSASYLARTPFVPLLCTLFNRGGNRRAFRLPGAGGDHGRTQKRDPYKLFRGGFLCSNRGPKRAIFGHNKFSYCFPCPLSNVSHLELLKNHYTH